MFQILIFSLYTALLTLFILKSKYFKSFGIRSNWIAVLFIIKIITGIFYWYLMINRYGGGDSLGMFRQGTIQVYYTLFKNPAIYLKLVFLPCTFPPLKGLEHLSHSIWSYGDESYYFIVRFHALVRLVSFGFASVHVVFYNFFSLIGILYLIKFLKQFIKGKDGLILMAFCLVPGITFWTSGMHKDGFGLAALGIFLYSLLNILKQDYRLRNFIAVLLSIIVIAVLRGFISFILAPTIVAFCWTYVKNNHTVLKFVWVQFLYLGSIYIIGLIVPEFNAIDYLFFIQHEFLNLKISSSTIPLTPLQPNLSSIISVLPEGFAHCVFRPYLWEINSILQLSSALENVLLILLLVVAIIFREKKKLNYPFILFCTFYAIGLYLLIGIIVPNLGAIVRYKCSAELFWIVLIIYLLDINRIKGYIFRNNHINTIK